MQSASTPPACTRAPRKRNGKRNGTKPWNGIGSKI